MGDKQTYRQYEEWENPTNYHMHLQKNNLFIISFIISYSYANMSEYIIFHHGVHLVGCDVDRNLTIYYYK